MKMTPRLFSTTLFLAFFTWASLASAQGLVQVSESFDNSSGLLSLSKGVDTDGFDFGFSNTNNAGGAAAGELGGTFSRTDDASTHYFADDQIGAISRLDALTVTGNFIITENLNMDGWAHIGYINRETADAFPLSESQNQLGVAIIEPNDDTGFRIIAVTNSQLGRSRGDVQRAPIGSKVSFVMTYEPSGLEDGNGSLNVDFTLEDGTVLNSFVDEVRNPDPIDWDFDAFIIGGVPASSADPDRKAIMYFDDVVYTINTAEGEPEQRSVTFDNGTGFLDLAKGTDTDGFDFGFSNTNNAGGAAAGEIGGTFSRTDDASTHYLADTDIGAISRLDALEVTGNFIITENLNMDGWAHIGYINRETADAFPLSESQNQLGVAIIEPNDDTGFRIIAVTNSQLGRSRGDVQRAPIGSKVSFVMTYTPSGLEDGNGSLNVDFTLEDGTVLNSFVDEVRNPDPIDWDFDAFIVGGVPASSADPERKAIMYFDDVVYTVKTGAGAAPPKTVRIGELIDGEHVLVNNLTAPLFIDLNLIPIPFDKTTYERDVDIFTGTSGPTLNHDGTQVDPSVTFELLSTTIDDGVNDNSLTGMDDWNINIGPGRRANTLPWETRMFGGQATFTSTNGNGVDFILFENAGNDDLFVQAVLADGTVGQWTQLATGDGPEWGRSGLLRIGSSGAGQDLVGLAWKVEAMLGPNGSPLPGDAEILGLRFNDPAVPGQEVDGGVDPKLLVAVIIKADATATVPIGELIDGEHVLVNNITAPLFIDLNLIPIPADNATYERDVDIFTGTSGPTLNHDGTQVDPSLTIEDLTTTIDDGVHNNSITAMDNWNINPSVGRRADTLPWETRNFGGQATFTSTNGNGVDFIMIESGGNDDLFVQPVLADGTVGQWIQLGKGDGAEWGRTGLITLEGGAGVGQDIVGLAWKVEAMLGPNGSPLPGDAEILGLRFNDPSVPGQEVDQALDPKLLVAVIKEVSADPFGGTDLGAGWFESSWYGTYNTSTTPWFFHLQHDFQFPVAGAAAGEVFIYDLASEDWWWTSSTSYPSIYSFGRASWIFYFIDTAGPRNFVDLITNEFFDLP